MKGLSKPLSSPSRSEKFPPPLMRFLRSNAGSRSRGRLRSSPMFYLRGRRSAPGVVETAQEPSSPKVTCIGQVRVRRSAKSKARRTGAAAAVKRRRWWLKKNLCFGKNSSKFLLRRVKNPFGGMLCKCGSVFGWGCCKKVDSTDSFRVFSNSRSRKTGKLDARSNGVCSSNGSERGYMNKCQNHGGGSLEIKRGFLETSSSSPPKNALMLTRCRSAPYRSSSLGGRFWGSPLAEKDDDNTAENGGESDELPASAIVEEKEEEEEEEEEEESSKEMESSAENVEEIKKIGGGPVHPLLLTRCKSEPARTGERLGAEAIFVRQRRLADDLVQTCSQQNS